MKIGHHDIKGMALLAPLSGVTDAAFRRIAAGFGAPLVVTEMVASREYLAGQAESTLRAAYSGVGLHAVQLAGCDPAVMGEAARLAEASGADLIDINMGCPAKKVTGGWAGSALMRDEANALAIVDRVVSAVKIPVTLKMRLGWDRQSMNAPRLASEAVARGIAMITVHGRTRCDFYGGSADWEAIRQTRQSIGVPLVANGDVVDDATATTCLNASGADAVMVGRGAVGRPWIVGEISRKLMGHAPEPVGWTARAEAAIAHLDALLGFFGAAKGLRHARKHLAAYADCALAEGRGLHRRDREALVRCDDTASVFALLRTAFEPPREEKAAA